jgi:hypothetical protein
VTQGSPASFPVSADGAVEAAQPSSAIPDSSGPKAAPGLAGLGRDPLAWTLALLGAGIAVFLVMWATGLIGGGSGSRVTGLAAMPCGVVLILATIRIRRTARINPRLRLVWSLIAVGLGCYGVGAAINYGVGSMPGLAGVWPVGLALELAAYPIFALALALLPKPPRTTAYDVALFSLDMSIIAWSGAILLWHFVIYQSARDAAQSLPISIGVSVFPTLDLALLCTVAALLVRGLPESTRAALGLALAALVLIFVGDVIAEIETLRGTYVNGGVSGAFYSIAWFGLALAAYLQWRVRDSGKPVVGLAGYTRTFPWFAYVAIALAFIGPVIPTGTT